MVLLETTISNVLVCFVLFCFVILYIMQSFPSQCVSYCCPSLIATQLSECCYSNYDIVHMKCKNWENFFSLNNKNVYSMRLHLFLLHYRLIVLNHQMQCNWDTTAQIRIVIKQRCVFPENHNWVIRLLIISAMSVLSFTTFVTS